MKKEIRIGFDKEEYINEKFYNFDLDEIINSLEEILDEKDYDDFEILELNENQMILSNFKFIIKIYEDNIIVEELKKLNQKYNFRKYLEI